MVGLISVLRIQRAVSIGNKEESVGLGALHDLATSSEHFKLKCKNTVVP